MKKYILLSLLFAGIIAFSCEENTETPIENDPPDPTEEAIDSSFTVNISGYVQKGPFINGTSITLYELDENLVQTGNSFNTQIIDNKGTFELDDIKLHNQYVEIKAEGFYFNEVLGKKSASQLILYALTDANTSENINVNILSDLEKHRIMYLVKNGMDFSEAKSQAQTEILRIFGIEKQDITASEYLDISKTGEDNAILLAISAILQGLRADAELAELIANLSTDIREDGVLDSENLMSDLVSQAKYLSPSEIRQNLEQRYDDMGVSHDIADFESIISKFIDANDTLVESLVEYPEIGLGGSNLLYPEHTSYNSTDDMSIANNSITAINSEDINLRLEIEFNQDCAPGDTLDNCTGNWGLWIDGSGWETEYMSPYVPEKRSYVFVNDDSGEHDMKISLVNHGFGQLKLFENDTLVLEKTFTW